MQNRWNVSEKYTAKLKICGLYRDIDISYVNHDKPDYIGFIFWPKSHRYVTAESAGALKKMLDPAIKAVGVFVDEDPEIILSIAAAGIIDVIQLHGGETEDTVKYIKEQSGLPVIKAVKMQTGTEHDKWADSCADYLLLDSGMGTGKPFDWSSAKTRPKKPFFLAGGINDTNVQEAIRLFHPYAVDLSSSVETDKKKAPEKIAKVVRAVRDYSED